MSTFISSTLRCLNVCINLHKKQHLNRSENVVQNNNISFAIISPILLFTEHFQPFIRTVVVENDMQDVL